MKTKQTKDEWQKFINLCHNTKNPKLLQELFELFFTLEEQEMLKARYAIIFTLLNKKMTQRKIAETHKVSIAQITRGSNALKLISPELELFLNKFKIDYNTH